jgi:hypothetical protein
LPSSACPRLLLLSPSSSCQATRTRACPRR